MTVLFSASEKQTHKIAADLAKTVKAPCVICLKGTLGAGKTAFARGFIQALCGKETTVQSPTFSLVQIYNSPRGEIWHFDMYRLKNKDEIFEIGADEAFYNAICLVEWSEKIPSFLPKHYMCVEIEIENDGRKITLSEV